MAAAIMAARKGAQVTILEHMDRLGKKILSTGNGRCNLTNLKLSKECYRCDQKEFPLMVLRRFGVKETLDFFDEIGVLTKDKMCIPTRNRRQQCWICFGWRSCVRV